MKYKVNDIVLFKDPWGDIEFRRITEIRITEEGTFYYAEDKKLTIEEIEAVSEKEFLEYITKRRDEQISFIKENAKKFIESFFEARNRK